MSTNLARIQPSNSALAEWSTERVDLIKRTIARGATDDELALFIQVCKRTGLDPFARQVYWIKRGNAASIQFGIDGLRLMAERTGQYAGSESHWCGPDGVWVDVWTDLENPPFAARTSVWKVGIDRPFTAVCRYASYAQKTDFWRNAPDNQLAKCSEGLALRKAFPADLAGYRQAAPELDRGGDRIIDQATGEITDDDAYDRVAAEYEASRPRRLSTSSVTSTTDPHRAPDLMRGAVTGAVPIEREPEIEPPPWEEYGRDEERQPALIDAPRPASYAGEATPAPSAVPDALATAAQVNAIYAIAAKERGMSRAAVDEATTERFGVVPTGMTKKQASAFITEMKGS